MRFVVIYTTTFGNTARIAEAIARGASSMGVTNVVDSAEAGSLKERPDLVFIGGPTQRHGASPELRYLLDALPASLTGVPSAPFDTRYRGAKLLMGSAAVETAKRIEKAGGRLVVAPESFFVARGGPAELQALEAGERERAEAWGRAVAAAAGQIAGAVS